MFCSLSTGCNVTLTSESYITSPLFPLNYPNNLVCTYQLKLTPSRRERLCIEFETIDIEETYPEAERPFTEILDIEEYDNCIADSITVHDGSNEQAYMLDRICGKKPKNRYMITGDTFFVKFKSNAYLAKQGFRARFYSLGVGGYLTDIGSFTKL